MEEKKRTIVMFGDSLTDYFPMEKLKDIDAQFINSGVAGDTIAEMGARLAYDVFPYKPDIIIMQGGANDFLMSLYPGARVLAERLIRYPSHHTHKMLHEAASQNLSQNHKEIHDKVHLQERIPLIHFP